MLLEDPATHPDITAPTAGSRVAPGAARVPRDLADLARRAHRRRGAALALVHLLLERGWGVDAVDAVVALPRRQIEALSGVRRPGTASSHVADQLVADHRARAAAVAPSPGRVTAG